MPEANTAAKQSSPRSRSGRYLRWVLIALALLLAVYLGIGGYIASRVTQIDADHPKGTKTPETYGLSYETVRFPARGEALQVAAWYIPNPNARRAMILVHGRDASKQDAVSGEFVGLGSALNRAGIAVLMIDLRGHGESEGERYSFGVFERRDVLGAVDGLLDQGFQPGSIGALGLSLGGASVIGAVCEEPAIGMMVLESTFADLSADRTELRAGSRATQAVSSGGLHDEPASVRLRCEQDPAG
jgi:alpha-beta hydrolase superfamily lysophospholipase